MTIKSSVRENPRSPAFMNRRLMRMPCRLMRMPRRRAFHAEKREHRDHTARLIAAVDGDDNQELGQGKPRSPAFMNRRLMRMPRRLMRMPCRLMRMPRRRAFLSLFSMKGAAAGHAHQPARHAHQPARHAHQPTVHKGRRAGFSLTELLIVIAINCGNQARRVVTMLSLFSMKGAPASHAHQPARHAHQPARHAHQPTVHKGRRAGFSLTELLIVIAINCGNQARRVVTMHAEKREHRDHTARLIAAVDGDDNQELGQGKPRSPAFMNRRLMRMPRRLMRMPRRLMRMACRRAFHAEKREHRDHTARLIAAVDGDDNQELGQGKPRSPAFMNRRLMRMPRRLMRMPRRLMRMARRRAFHAEKRDHRDHTARA